MNGTPGLVWVLCLLSVSVGLPLWHYYGMNTTLRLNAGNQYRAIPVDDRIRGGTSVATLEKHADATVLHCTLTNAYIAPYCELHIVLSQGANGLDLSRFDTISLRIHTSGPVAVPVRVLLYNFNPAYSSTADPDSLKVNQLQYVPSHAAHPFVLSLNRFHVATWWIRSSNAPPKYTDPDLRNITMLAVSLGVNTKPGRHTITVGPIVFAGKWFTTVHILTFILALWLVSALAWVTNMACRVRRSVHRMRRDAAELKEVNAALSLERNELEMIATHDELTGLCNRAGMRNYLYEAVANARRDAKPLAAIFMDIDHFKAINDHYGHLVGDEVLVQFAKLLSACTRSTDTACRWGGEEFILICNATSRAAAEQIAENLRVGIANNSWPEGIALTASFGVAQFKRSEGEGAQRFLQRADDMLYKAKAAGRNTVVAK